MAMKLNYFVLFLMLLFLFCIRQTQAVGIIVADEAQQTMLFNSSSTSVLAFADTLAKHYDKVILHLGRGFVFRRGNIYTSQLSRTNLSLFCARLNQKNVQVYIWFLDSFGSESFKKLYAQHEEMIDENLEELNKLGIQYQAIVVDIEWINLEEPDHNADFIAIMKYLRKKIGENTALHFFASLTNLESENQKRGYTTLEIMKYATSPIVMLYPTESGYNKGFMKIYPRMNDKRINDLTHYFAKKNWSVVISMHEPWLIINNNRIIEINKPENKIEFRKALLKFKKIKETDYMKFSYFILTKDFEFTSIDNKKIKLDKKDKIIIAHVKSDLIKPDYYLWEYFNMQQ